MKASRPTRWGEVFTFQCPFGHADDYDADHLSSVAKSEPPTCGKALFRFVRFAQSILPLQTKYAIEVLSSAENGRTKQDAPSSTIGLIADWELPSLFDAVLRLAVDQTDRASLDRWMTPVLNEARSLAIALTAITPDQLVCHKCYPDAWHHRRGPWQQPFEQLEQHLSVLTPMAISRLIAELNSSVSTGKRKRLPRPGPSEHRVGWTLRELCEHAGVGRTTFKEMRDLAKVKGGKQGEHNYCYTRDDVQQIAASTHKRIAGKKLWREAASAFDDLLATGVLRKSGIQTPSKRRRNAA